MLAARPQFRAFFIAISQHWRPNEQSLSKRRSGFLNALGRSFGDFYRDIAILAITQAITFVTADREIL